MKPYFIVLTRTFFQSSGKKKVLDLVKKSFPIFKKKPGLVSIASHISHDGTHTMTYMAWKDKESHEACMVSTDFEDLNEDWGKLLASGEARFELQTYDLLNE